MKLKKWIWPCLAFAAITGCATTSHDKSTNAPTWKSASSSNVTALPPLPEQIPVYVASIGIASSLAERHPELTQAQLGLGISNRIVEALFDTRRFTFLEEKAEMARRIGEQLHSHHEADVPAAGVPEDVDGRVRWILYGEVAALELERHESVSGVRARATVETRITVQLRMLHRDTGRFFPTSATGAAESPRFKGQSELDAHAVSEATEKAVRSATTDLVSLLDRSTETSGT